MLTQIRERASGWLAWVLVIFISIPFALWGVQSYFENPEGAPVATVNGEPIGIYDFQNELSRQRRLLGAQTDNLQMRTQVAEYMVGNRLMTQYVGDHNYQLSDAALKTRIESNSAFADDNGFDPVLYRELLRSNGYTPRTFEALERQNALIEQLASSVRDTAFVTDAEVNRLLILQTQTRKADYAILPSSRFAEKIEISDEDAKKHYDGFQSSYETPARIKIDYIELSVANLSKDVDISESEIAQTYENTRERYKQAEVRKASHILFSVAADADDDTRAKTRADAEKILADARGGADFGELAKQHSGDPGSKDRGGDLGVVARGQMVKPFEDAVFDMGKDEIRGPVETRFGYHLIKLTDLTEERQKTLDEAREEVIEEARRLYAENQFAELGETFENLVFEDADSLTTAADELGLEVKQSDWFTEHRGEGIAEEARVRTAAFSEDVRDEGLNSQVIELGFDRLVAVRKAEYEEAKVRPFDTVQTQIKAQLRARQAADEARELGDKLTADLVAATIDWKQLLTQEKIESQALPERRDDVPGNLSALGDAVFAHPAPAEGETTYSGVSVSGGDYAIYALRAVNHGKVEDVDPAKRDELEAQLLARDGSGLYRQLRDTLRNEADVYINEEQVEDPVSGDQ